MTISKNAYNINNNSFNIEPFYESRSANYFYTYDGTSAVDGSSNPYKLGDAFNIMFHYDNETGTMSLIGILTGLDGDGNASSSNSDISFNINGIPSGYNIQLDMLDSGGQDSFNDNNGILEFISNYGAGNTDGFVIEGINSATTITIDITSYTGGINKWAVINSDGNVIYNIDFTTTTTLTIDSTTVTKDNKLELSPAPSIYNETKEIKVLSDNETVIVTNDGTTPSLAEYIAFDDLNPPTPFIATVQDGRGNVGFDGGFPKLYNTRWDSNWTTFEDLTANFKYFKNMLDFIANQDKVNAGNNKILFLGDASPTAGDNYNIIQTGGSDFNTSINGLCSIAGYQPIFRTIDDYTGSLLNPTYNFLEQHCALVLFSTNSDAWDVNYLTEQAVSNIINYRNNNNGIFLVTDHGYPINEPSAYIGTGFNVEVIDVDGNQTRSTGTTSFSIEDIEIDIDNNSYVVAGSQNSIIKSDSNGTQQWEYTNGGYSNYYAVSVDFDLNVYGGVEDTNSGGFLLIKLNSSGALQWSYTQFANSISQIEVDINNNVYASSTTGEIHKVDSSGNQVWSINIGSYVRSLFVDKEYNVYTGSDDNTIRKIDGDNGNELWSFSPSVSSIESLVVNDDLEIIVSTNARLQKYNQDQSNVWDISIPGTFIDMDIGYYGEIYGVETSTLYKYDTDGNQIWTYVSSSNIGCVALQPGKQSSGAWRIVNGGFIGTANQVAKQFGARFEGNYDRNPVNVGFLRNNYGDHPLYDGISDSEDIYAAGSESRVFVTEYEQYTTEADIPLQKLDEDGYKTFKFLTINNGEFRNFSYTYGLNVAEVAQFVDESNNPITNINIGVDNRASFDFNLIPGSFSSLSGFIKRNGIVIGDTIHDGVAQFDFYYQHDEDQVIVNNNDEIEIELTQPIQYSKVLEVNRFQPDLNKPKSYGRILNDIQNPEWMTDNLKRNTLQPLQYLGYSNQKKLAKNVDIVRRYMNNTLEKETANSRVYSSSTNAQNAQQTTEPPSQQDIFNTWGVFASEPNNPSTFYNTRGDAPAQEPYNTWIYDSNTGNIVQTNNVGFYTGFVSNDPLENYEVEVTLTSPSTDDDIIGFVACHNWDSTNSINNTLSFIIHAGGIGGIGGSGTLMACVKNHFESGEVLVDTVKHDDTYRNNDGFNGWNSQQMRLKIVRNGNIITAVATNWDDLNNYNENSKITVDLSTNTDLQIFQGPQSYGYSSRSQPDSTFQNINLKGTLNFNFVVDMQNQIIYRYDRINDLWEELSISIQDFYGYPRKVRNSSTGEEFYITENSVQQLN